MTMEDVERCVDASLRSELGFAWATAGDAPDARELTSVCLCVVVDDRVTAGVAAAHGTATPANAWADITSWDRYREASNVAACLAWAGRRRDDRVVVGLLAPKGATSASREELLGAVLEDPADDRPRLVLADWLIERGDPRGEFISIQCELARSEQPAHALKEREAALLADHREAWSAPGPALTRFRRGFVESVTVPDAQALPDLEPFFLREPVTELVFESARLIDSERFAALGWLERLRTLEFRANRAGWLGRERLAHVLESRRLRRLTKLLLFGQRVGDEGVKLLAEQGGASLPALEGLAVGDDAITEKGVAPLAASRWAARFQSLYLADNQLGVGGAEAIADAPSKGQLRQLSLGGNGLGNEGAIVIACATRLRTLKILELPRNRIGAAGLEALLESDSLEQLTTLDLTGNPVGSVGKKRLVERFR